MAGPGIAATWRVRELSLTAAKLFSGAAGSGPRHSMTISQITLSPSHFFSAAVYGMQVNGPQEQAPSPRRWPVSPVPVRGALAALGIGIEAEQTAGGVSDPFATPIDLSPRGGGAATASCSSAGATATWAATDWLLASAWGCLHLRAGEGRRHGPSWGIKLCSSPEGGGSSWGIALGRGLTADPPGSASASLDDSLGLPALLRAPADSCSQPLLAEASMRLQVADGWTVTPAVLAISGEGHGSWAIGLQSQLCF